MLFSVIIFTKLKLHARNEIIRVLLKFQRECIMFGYRMGLGKAVLTRAVLNILHFSGDLVFKKWSYAMIRLGIRWYSMR